MAITNNTPIYLQIAESLMDDIILGRYKAEARMPSVREHAADCQVNANTVLRAFEQLERHGIIFNRRGLGYFVSTDAVGIIRRLRLESFRSGELNYFFSRLQQLDVTPDALANEYREFLQTASNN